MSDTITAGGWSGHTTIKSLLHPRITTARLSFQMTLAQDGSACIRNTLTSLFIHVFVENGDVHHPCLFIKVTGSSTCLSP